jgi:hypothetical protein
LPIIFWIAAFGAYLLHPSDILSSENVLIGTAIAERVVYALDSMDSRIVDSDRSVVPNIAIPSLSLSAAANAISTILIGIKAWYVELIHTTPFLPQYRSGSINTS